MRKSLLVATLAWAGQALAGEDFYTPPYNPIDDPVENSLILPAEKDEVKDARNAYRMALNIAGLLWRAAKVCDKPSFSKAASNWYGVGDVPSFELSFPDQSHAWIIEGAGTFNAAVMKFGITTVCQHAMSHADPDEAVISWRLWHEKQ
jgi:hypothetical protein